MIDGVIRSVTAAGVCVLEHQYGANGVIEPHAHEASFVSFTVSGTYDSVVGSSVIEQPPGVAFYHSRWHEHEVRVVGSTPIRALTVDIPDSMTSRLAEIGVTEPEHLRADSGVLPWLCARIRDELAASPPASSLMFEGIVLEMLGAIAQRRCPSGDAFEPRWLARVEELIQAEFDCPITVAGLAERVDVHPVHLSRTWRRFRGTSIGESVNHRRVEEACRRLAAGATSLADLALEVGFADQTHFSRVFKRIRGLPPGAFRRDELARARKK